MISVPVRCLSLLVSYEKSLIFYDAIQKPVVTWRAWLDVGRLSMVAWFRIFFGLTDFRSRIRNPNFKFRVWVQIGYKSSILKADRVGSGWAWAVGHRL